MTGYPSFASKKVFLFYDGPFRTRGLFFRIFIKKNTLFYYMEESVLLGTKPLVDSIRHFIRDPSGVFSVCHLCECRIFQ